LRGRLSVGLGRDGISALLEDARGAAEVFEKRRLIKKERNKGCW
jgi:hypothetical protein